MHRATRSVAVFGKVPTHGDFVRHAARSPAVRAFDAWLQRGLFLAKQHRTGGLGERYDAAPPTAFVFRADAGTLVGVMQASRDSAGRAFPLIVAVEADATASGATDLATTHQAFVHAAAAKAARAAAGGVGHREVDAVAAELEGARRDDRLDAPYRTFLRDTTFGTFGRAVWEYFEDSRKYVLFRHLVDTLGDGRGTALRVGLRFPIDAARPTLSACFWLDVCRRLSGAALDAATCFWDVPQSSVGGRTDASMLLFATSPPPAALGDVIGLEPPGDGVWDLQTAPAGEPAALAALAIPERYGRLLEDETTSLADFLERL